MPLSEEQFRLRVVHKLTGKFPRGLRVREKMQYVDIIQPTALAQQRFWMGTCTGKLMNDKLPNWPNPNAPIVIRPNEAKIGRQHRSEGQKWRMFAVSGDRLEPYDWEAGE